MRKLHNLITALLQSPIMRPSVETSWARIDQLDFANAKMKLMQPAPEGKGWSQDQADLAEIWYRRFLKVCVKYPGHFTVPNGPIDDFWHQHILDTAAYEQDCLWAFGRIMHHFPYYGLNGDAEERDADFALTNEIYEREFGATCMEMVECFPRIIENPAMNCGDNGGGTGCSQKSPADATRGQVCDNRPSPALVAQNCGDGGGGTGCGQGCRRGG